MGQVIDFQEAKKKILGQSTAEESSTVSADLSNALEEFSFSRLSKLERITRILTASIASAGSFDSDTNIVAQIAKDLDRLLPEDVLKKPFTK